MTRIADLAFTSRRSPVYGRRGMVAASQPLAVAAGLEILAAGGNAADAAVATAAALAVVEPMSTGIGGDCFALYFDADTRQVTALNGSGRSPSGLTLERLAREGLASELPLFHPYTVTVPGACAGWCDLVARHGRLAIPTVLLPAIRLAEEGAPVAPLTAAQWQRSAQAHHVRAPRDGALLGELLIEGRAPRAGEIWRNLGLARTLRAVAEGGTRAFYQGPIAESIARAVQQAGGCLATTDLAEHASCWQQPISTTFHGLRVWECPPNGQGLAALLALNLVEGFDLASLAPLSTARLHLLIEAMRVAFADALHYVADPDVSPAPVVDLLSKEYAAERRCLIDPGKANRNPQFGVPMQGSNTVYLSVVDGQGNACSFINSIYSSFGTGIVPAGWGFALHNRGHNFTLVPGHPNALAPGKRPYHTIIPALATRETDGSLLASFGVMGKFMQPQGHLQVLVALTVDGLDPQQALDLPRFCLQEAHGVGNVGLEEGIAVQTMAELAAMGHPVVPIAGVERSLFGRGQVILRDEHGVLCGGSDPRADGCAMPL